VRCGAEVGNILPEEKILNILDLEELPEFTPVFCKEHHQKGFK
jgi:hypothetical protein